MVKRWRIHSHDPDRIAGLQQAAGVTSVIAQLLICRGICDPDAARRFLDPKLSDLRDPNDLPGCAEAAELLVEAIRDGRRIVVYGDYDVDGISGTAILCRCIRMLGGNAGYYIPHRIDEGYGLNRDAVDQLAEQQTRLLVTVDCGIGSVDEAVAARQCGLDLIVTDHHQPGHRLPPAASIVHPALPGGAYPFPHLSGSGVAFKLAWSICQREAGARRVGDRMKEFLLQAVGLASLGTIADVVPLIDENRVLVRHGLDALKQRPPVGVAALIEVVGLDDKPRLDAEDVAFSLGPRLNAAGRLGQAQLAAELLMTERPERAREVAAYIDGLNASRQTLERSIYLAAHKQAKERFDPEGDPALVLADHGWHPGVIGIVAGRLAEKYHRPVILISWDPLGVKPGVGSARSVPGFNLYAALETCGHHLDGFGGHAAAAGLTLKPERLDEFRADFCEFAGAEIGDDQRTADLWIDAEAPLSAFTLQVVSQIERLGPFGQANHRPLVCASGVRLAEPPRALGTGGRHIAMKLQQHDVTLRAVAFGGADWTDALIGLSGPIDVAFRPVVNTFRKRRNVELHLVDWRPG